MTSTLDDRALGAAIRGRAQLYIRAEQTIDRLYKEGQDRGTEWLVAAAASREAAAEILDFARRHGDAPEVVPIPVLDHGYLRLVETWGRGDAGEPEAGIIEAARMSTQGAFRGWERDQRLLTYLHKQRHTGPFEFAGATIEVQAPIVVVRQWHRHRTQSYNEASARYAPLPEADYLPTVERILLGGGHLTKQAAGLEGAELTREKAEAFVGRLAQRQAESRRDYAAACADGVPLELARGHLTNFAYTRFRATANLHNWLRFLGLRNKPNAQWEIRQYAAALEQLLAEHFPRTLNLFRESP